MKLKKSFLWLKIGLLLALIGGGWWWQSKSTNKSQVSYQTSIATRGDLIVAVSASGQVTTSNSRTVTTTASGVVKRVLVANEDTVKTGTPLLEIDLDLSGRQKLQAAYSTYQSAINSLKSSQDKVFDLESQVVAAKNVFVNQWSMQSPDDPTYIQKHNTFLSAQAALDNLQNTLKQQRAAVESARLSYQMAGSTVYAPISGTVTAISLTPGMILNPTSDSANSSNSENKIAIVKTGATPSISVNLTEIDVVKVETGDKVTLTLDAFPNKTFTGKVIAIDSVGTVSSGVVGYPTIIQLDVADISVLPNMSASANIITDIRKDVIIVPTSAIQMTGEQTTVRLKKKDQIVSVNVEVGLNSETETEIVGGVDQGDEVVTAIINQDLSSGARNTSTSPFGGFGGGGGQFRMIR